MFPEKAMLGDMGNGLISKGEVIREWQVDLWYAYYE
jgi:hypothetical protein